MIQPADSHDPIPAPSLGHLLYCVVLGALFYYLVGFVQAQVTAMSLPQFLLDIWSSAPVFGGLLVNALLAAVTYWLLAAAIGFAIAAAVRHDYVFFGAVATGVYLMVASATSYDGWQAFVEVGPEFWLALRADALINDPFGTASRWFALPVAAWLWGRYLFDARPALRGAS